jgi:hypothetical protein
MKKINMKRLAASAVIFLFTNLASPMMAEAPVVHETAPPVTQQEYTEVLSHIQVHSPRVVTISPEEHVAIHSISIPSFLAEDLSTQVFHFQNNVVSLPGGYANEIGAYVNTSATDMNTGLVSIINAENTLQKDLKQLLGAPDKISVRTEIVSPFFGPRVMFDQKSGCYFLVFEPYDFRFAEKPTYNKKALEQTLVSAFGAFQGYQNVIKNKEPIIHTAFWGKDYHHNEKVTTALQLLASSLCHIKMIFHVNSNSQNFQEAVSFVQEQNGVNVHDFLDRLLYKTVDPSWQAT